MARRIALLAVTTALLTPAAAPAAGPQRTASALAKHMRGAGASSGALVVDLDSGRELFSSRADVGRVPASVEKLYTTAAALLRLGPDATFVTQAVAAEPADEFGLVDGKLWLRGGGDPTFGTNQAQLLADRLLLKGVLEIAGGVYGDESAFDRRRGVPSSNFALTLDVNPLGALTYNRAWTRSPARHAARQFRRALRTAGITVGRRVSTGVAPEAGTVLAQVESPSLGYLARVTNVHSDNFVAEILLKALGREFGSGGTTYAGAAVVRRTLARWGLRPRIYDGSGLSRANRTTPRQVVALLRRMQDHHEFRSSFAIAGRTGTMRDRLRGSAARNRCRAKTGTVRAVSTLAGYCTSTSGARTAFALLMNNVDIYGARRLQDRMLDVLARYHSG